MSDKRGKSWDAAWRRTVTAQRRCSVKILFKLK